MGVEIGNIAPEILSFPEVLFSGNEIGFIVVFEKKIQVGILVCLILLPGNTKFTEPFKGLTPGRN